MNRARAASLAARLSTRRPEATGLAPSSLLGHVDRSIEQCGDDRVGFLRDTAFVWSVDRDAVAQLRKTLSDDRVLAIRWSLRPSWIDEDAEEEDEEENAPVYAQRLAPARMESKGQTGRIDVQTSSVRRLSSQEARGAPSDRSTAASRTRSVASQDVDDEDEDLESLEIPIDIQISSSRTAAALVFEAVVIPTLAPSAMSAAGDGSATCEFTGLRSMRVYEGEKVVESEVLSKELVSEIRRWLRSMHVDARLADFVWKSVSRADEYATIDVLRDLKTLLKDAPASS